MNKFQDSLYNYLKDKYPPKAVCKVGLKGFVGINIHIDSENILLIRKDPFQPLEFKVFVYNPSYPSDVGCAHFCFNHILNISKKDFKEKILKDLHCPENKSINTLQKHIKEFFTPNSVKFIKGL